MLKKYKQQHKKHLGQGLVHILTFAGNFREPGRFEGHVRDNAKENEDESRGKTLKDSTRHKTNIHKSLNPACSIVNLYSTLL